MAQVDPDDDAITRYIVRHYAFDPHRHERRHRTVVAFDNALDFESFIEDAERGLDARRAGGRADSREHFSGVVKYPGDDQRQRARRVAMQAIRHGVHPPDHMLRTLGDEIVQSRRDSDR